MHQTTTLANPAPLPSAPEPDVPAAAVGTVPQPQPQLRSQASATPRTYTYTSPVDDGCAFVCCDILGFIFKAIIGLMFATVIIGTALILFKASPIIGFLYTFFMLYCISKMCDGR